jgi:hypothetical protein
MVEVETSFELHGWAGFSVAGGCEGIPTSCIQPNNHSSAAEGRDSLGGDIQQKSQISRKITCYQTGDERPLLAKESMQSLSVNFGKRPLAGIGSIQKQVHRPVPFEGLAILSVVIIIIAGSLSQPWFLVNHARNDLPSRELHRMMSRQDGMSVARELMEELGLHGEVFLSDSASDCFTFTLPLMGTEALELFQSHISIFLCAMGGYSRNFYRDKMCTGVSDSGSILSSIMASGSTTGSICGG